MSTITYEQFLAMSTLERRCLAADLRDLHADVTFGASSHTVVLDLWDELVRFAETGEFRYLEDPTVPVTADDVSRVLAQLRDLDGCWVDGDLDVAATLTASRVGSVFDVATDAPRWVSLEQIASRTGRRLP